MDIKALATNITESMKICPSWPDRLNRMLWLYHKAPVLRWFTEEKREISFQFSEPVDFLRCVVRDNGGADAFIMSEVFQHRYYDLNLPNNVKRVLDLGANIGMTALFFARKWPGIEIVCVEPIPDNVNLLRRNLDLNGVEACVLANAVTMEDCEVEMTLCVNDYGHKISNIPFGASLKGKHIEVSGISMETLLKKVDWDHVDLCKMDIEGYEGILIRENSTWLSRIKALCIECHEDVNRQKIEHILSIFGFERPRYLGGDLLFTQQI